MSESRITPEDFAASWIAYHGNSSAGSALWHASEWVVGAEIEWSIKQPRDLLLAIELVGDFQLTDWQIELLGSGPLETLLARQYDEVILQIMSLSSRNHNISSALRFVNPPEDRSEDFERRAIDKLPKISPSFTKTTLSDVLLAYSELPGWAGINCELDRPNNFGDYPIHVAATRCKVDEIEILLEAGADVNQRGEEGFSPLLNAVEQGCLTAVALLLARGAIVDLASSDGTTPEELADLLQEREIILFLKNWKSINPIRSE
jgi:uncharacterized protein